MAMYDMTYGQSLRVAWLLYWRGLVLVLVLVLGLFGVPLLVLWGVTTWIPQR